VSTWWAFRTETGFVADLKSDRCAQGMNRGLKSNDVVLAPNSSAQMALLYV